MLYLETSAAAGVSFFRRYTGKVSTPSNWLPIARLLRPQGRRGELLADPLTDLRDVFSAGRSVWLTPTDTEPAPGAAPGTLESHFFPTGRNAGRIVLKLSAANSISEAETLQGATLWLPASDFPTLEEDTYFVRDLVGCTLIDRGTPAGEIIDVEFATTPDGRTRLDDAAPLLVIQTHPATPDDDGTQLVPLIRAWLQTVDTAAKQVHMTLPDGLLETDNRAEDNQQ